MSKLFDWLWKVLGEMPSTNVRIGVTLCVFVATAVRYQLSGVHVETLGGQLGFAAWEPSLEWCGLLAASMGIDAAQYLSKRKTHQPSPPSAPDVEDTAPANKPKPVEETGLVG